RIFDKDDGFSTYTSAVTVKNVAPDGTFTNDGPINNGGTARASFPVVTDPSPVDTAAGFRYSIKLDSELLATSYADASPTSYADFTFDNATTYTVYGRVFDKDNGSRDFTTTVIVNGTTPVVTVTNPAGAEGSTTPLSASFTDSGAGETHTAIINWGDG